MRERFVIVTKEPPLASHTKKPHYRSGYLDRKDSLIIYRDYLGGTRRTLTNASPSSHHRTISPARGRDTGSKNTQREIFVVRVSPLPIRPLATPRGPDLSRAPASGRAGGERLAARRASPCAEGSACEGSRLYKPPMCRCSTSAACAHDLAVVGFGRPAPLHHRTSLAPPRPVARVHLIPRFFASERNRAELRGRREN